MKAVPKVGAGSWRSTWPWAAGSISYYGYAESCERGFGGAERREVAGGPRGYAELQKG